MHIIDGNQEHLPSDMPIASFSGMPKKLQQLKIIPWTTLKYQDKYQSFWSGWHHSTEKLHSFSSSCASNHKPAIPCSGHMTSAKLLELCGFFCFKSCWSFGKFVLFRVQSKFDVSPHSSVFFLKIDA